MNPAPTDPPPRTDPPPAGPRFGQAVVSGIPQSSQTPTEDGRSLSILFTGFQVAVQEGPGGAVAGVSLTIPLTGVTEPVTVTMRLRGVSTVGGASVMGRLDVEVNLTGLATVFTDPHMEIDQTVTITLPVAGAVLVLNLILSCQAVDPQGSALLTLDSLELTIG